MVLDCSVTLAWYFDDEKRPEADAVLTRVSAEGAFVPSLWRLEVANGFLSALRRQRIDVAFRDASLADLEMLPITTDENTAAYAWSATLRLAERFRLTLYDAAYLELAQRLNLPFASLDRQLRSGARGLGLAVLGA
jgi:predicted nucleic acid-binding protein